MKWAAYIVKHNHCCICSLAMKNMLIVSIKIGNKNREAMESG